MSFSFYDDSGNLIILEKASVEKIFRDRPRNPWVGKGKLILVSTNETYIVRSEADVLKIFPDIPWSRFSALEDRISILTDEISDLKDQIEDLKKKIKAFD